MLLSRLDRAGRLIGRVGRAGAAGHPLDGSRPRLFTLDRAEQLPLPLRNGPARQVVRAAREGVDDILAVELRPRSLGVPADVHLRPGVAVRRGARLATAADRDLALGRDLDPRQ